MPIDPIAPPAPEPQPNLPGVDPTPAPAADPVPEVTFTRTEALAMIKKAEGKAVAEYRAAHPEPDPVEPDVTPEPPVVEPKETPEAILLGQELEAEKAKNVQLQADNDLAAASALKVATCRKIAELLALDSKAIPEPAAQLAMTAEIYEAGQFSFTDGELSHKDLTAQRELSHKDLTAQPAQIITDFLATRSWYARKNPEGSGAAPASPAGSPQGTNGQSVQFDGSKIMDFYDAADAASAWDRKHPKG